MSSQQSPLKRYPRITLRCGNCTNEFCINVMRFSTGEPVNCQVCGEHFPEDLGRQFAQALEALFQVKHELSNRKNGFNLSFLYKSTFKQPPAPYAFEPGDFPDDEPN